MQALLEALDHRGFAVAVTAQNETIVNVLDEPMQIALIERFRQVKVKRTYGDTIELEPCGRLRLRVGASYSNSGVEDRPPRLIESRLNDFVAGLVRRALEAKQARAIYEERKHRWHIHDEEHRRRQQQRDSDRAAIRRLHVLAARWRRNERVSQFVTAMEQCIGNGRLAPEVLDVATRRLEWAKNQLQQQDQVAAFLIESWPSAPLPEPASMPWTWK
jgi:hypothetical protein